MSKEVKEEILVITTQDMIGSVGGSLGMFFGFSMYTFVIFLIDKSLMQVANRVQAYNTAWFEIKVVTISECITYEGTTSPKYNFQKVAFP